MTQPNKFMIGTVAGGIGGMVTLSSTLDESNVDKEPDFKFTTFSGRDDLLDGSQRGKGYSYCEMDWAQLSDTQRYTLRQYCENALSSMVLTRVPTNETDSDGIHKWHTFQAQMIWPAEAERRTLWIGDSDAPAAGIWEAPKIIFRALQQQDTDS